MTSENKNATVNEFIRILFSLAFATPREPMNVPIMAPPNTTILADFSDNKLKYTNTATIKRIATAKITDKAVPFMMDFKFIFLHL